MRNVLVAIVLAAGGWVAYARFIAGPDPLETLTIAPPERERSGSGGVEDLGDYGELPKAVEGRHTIVVIYLPSCRACRRMDRRLDDLLTVRPDVAVLKVKYSPQLAQDLEVDSVPYVVIYGADGTLLAADDARSRPGSKLLDAWIRAEYSASKEG